MFILLLFKRAPMGWFVLAAATAVVLPAAKVAGGEPEAEAPWALEVLLLPAAPIECCD